MIKANFIFVSACLAAEHAQPYGWQKKFLLYYTIYSYIYIYNDRILHYDVEEFEA